MTTLTRILSALALVTTLFTAPACMETPSHGAYPVMDDEDVDAMISKEEALAIAVTALEGFNDGDYEAWTTHWDDSMLAAISKKDWLAARGPMIEEWGQFVEVLETRMTFAQKDGHVRFSFLVEFEHVELMFINVYPEDGNRIVGVHLAYPDGANL